MSNFGFPSNSNYAQSQVSSSTTYRESTLNGVENGGLFSREECKNLARKIIQTYDGNNDGVCQTIEVAKWLVDCYRSMNKSFEPTATDIASYMHVIDRNRSGKVSVDQLEQFILRYFLNTSKG